MEAGGYPRGLRCREIMVTIRQRENGTNLGCVLNIESADLLGELHIGGKEKGNHNCESFGYHNWYHL